MEESETNESEKPASVIPTLDPATELAKHIGPSVSKIVEALLVKPATAVGGILTDQVSFWRWKNRWRIAERAAEILKTKTIRQSAPVPPDFVIPLIEASGEIENPSLSEMWSELLANGIASVDSRHPAFISVLKELSGDDAKALSYVASHEKHSLGYVDNASTALSLTTDGLRIVRANLFRLSLITDDFRSVSDFGAAFVKSTTGTTPVNWKTDHPGGQALHRKANELDYGGQESEAGD